MKIRLNGSSGISVYIMLLMTRIKKNELWMVLSGVSALKIRYSLKNVISEIRWHA
jgi:hypothetical protein